MASMFKKPRRNFRRKVADSDSDQENVDQPDSKLDEFEAMEVGDVLSMGETSSVDNTDRSDKQDKKKKKRDKEKSGAKLLSFGDEEEAESEVIRVKKSSHSKRIAKMLKRENREMKGELDPAEEKDRAENGDKVQKDSSHRSDDEEKRAAEKIRRLREELRTLNGEEAEEAEECEDDGTPTFRHRLARGEIPDARTIHLIRKQRQQAREHGEEFIPLEETPADKKSGTSRLVRDDEHDRSDDEEDRINFTVNKAAVERQQMRDDFLAAEHGKTRGQGLPFKFASGWVSGLS